MQAILVRHGETEYNAQGMLQGYAPVPLSGRGRQQAALVGQRLRAVGPSVNMFRFQDEKWDVVTLNDMAHLATLV